MKYEVVDNFLDKDTFNEIKSSILDNVNFPWYFCNGVSGKKDVDKDSYLFHLVYDEKINSSLYDNLIPILEKIEFKQLIRIKVNLYLRTEKIIKHNNHVDYTFKHSGCIFYLNTNNGKTILNNDIEIDSIENRILFFDPTIIHCSTTCTDYLYRSNINFNYF
jgi:hypothetical protein